MIEALTGLAGLGLSGAGGILSASAQRTAAKQMRDLLDKFLKSTTAKAETAQAREKALSAEELFQAQRAATRAQAQAERAGSARLFQTLSSPAYQMGAGYISDMFAKGIPDVIAGEYAGRIQSAQAARGLEGNMAAVDEAAMLTKMAEEGRRSMLPNLRQLAMDPFELKQQALQAQMGTQGTAQQLGLAQFMAALQGRQAGSQIAYQDVLPLAQLGAQLTAQQPISAASPWANALGALGGGLMANPSLISSFFGGAGAPAAVAPTGSYDVPESPFGTPNYYPWSW